MNDCDKQIFQDLKEELSDLKKELSDFKGLFVIVLAHMEEQCRCLNELYDYIGESCDFCDNELDDEIEDTKLN